MRKFIVGFAFLCSAAIVSVQAADIANPGPCAVFGSIAGTCLQGGGPLGTPSSGVATNLTGTASGLTAGTATNATNSAITDDNSTAATMNLIWATTNTGNLPLKTTSTKLTFIPNTGALSATSFNASGTAAAYLLFDRTSDATNLWLTYATSGTSFRLYNVNDATDWMTVTKATGTASFFGLIKPSIAATPTCGSGCSSVTGNPQKLVITTGTAQTSVTVNFGVTWSAAPVCTVSSNSTASVVDIASTSTTAITFGASVALTGALLNVLCF